MKLKELEKILKENKINYKISKYANKKSILIKGKNYKLEIYEDKGLVSDFQKIPYLYGRMGKTTIEQIIKDIKDVTGKRIKLIYQMEIEL